MKKHMFLHLLGCGLPLVLLFILPSFGLNMGMNYLIFFILMIACHILMMSGHGHSHMEKQKERVTDKSRGRECH